MLGPRHADRDRKAQLRPHALADSHCNLPRRTEQVGAAGNVGEGFIDGYSLNEWGEIADHPDGGVAQPLVFAEMSADKGEMRAQFARLPARHAAANPEGPGFVGSREHNPAADRNRPAAQGRVKQLFYGSIEGVQVRMKDGGCRRHPKPLPMPYRKTSRN
jgi:hypothetical protein